MKHTSRVLLALCLCAPIYAQKGRPQRIVTFTATGTNTITGTPDPALSAYSEMSSTQPPMEACFEPAADNTSTVTVNLNGIGAIALVKPGGVLVAGDLVAKKKACFAYNATDGNATLTTPPGTGSGGGSETTTPTNSGAGAAVLKTSTNVVGRTLDATAPITVTQNTDTITVAPTLCSQAEAEAGSATACLQNALRVSQAIAALAPATVQSSGAGAPSNPAGYVGIYHDTTNFRSYISQQAGANWSQVLDWYSGTGAPSGGACATVTINLIYIRTDAVGSEPPAYACIDPAPGGSPVWVPLGGAAIATTTASTSTTSYTFTRTASIHHFKLTLGHNIASSTLSGAAAGDILTFEICQDGTGGRTFVWPTGFTKATTPGLTLSKCYTQAVKWDGSAAIPLAPMATDDAGLVIPPTTVSGLGTCNSGNEGKRWGVTDADTPVALATVAGGASAHVAVYCNGTNWIVQ